MGLRDELEALPLVDLLLETLDGWGVLHGMRES